MKHVICPEENHRIEHSHFVLGLIARFLWPCEFETCMILGKQLNQCLVRLDAFYSFKLLFYWEPSFLTTIFLSLGQSDFAPSCQTPSVTAATLNSYRGQALYQFLTTTILESHHVLKGNYQEPCLMSAADSYMEAYGGQHLQNTTTSRLLKWCAKTGLTCHSMSLLRRSRVMVMVISP